MIMLRAGSRRDSGHSWIVQRRDHAENLVRFGNLIFGQKHADRQAYLDAGTPCCRLSNAFDGLKRQTADLANGTDRRTDGSQHCFVSYYRTDAA